MMPGNSQHQNSLTEMEDISLQHVKTKQIKFCSFFNLIICVDAVRKIIAVGITVKRDQTIWLAHC